MKVILLVLIVLAVLSWTWTVSAAPLLCSEKGCENVAPVHRCKNPQHNHDPQSLFRTKRDVLDFVKNASTYFGQKLRVIDKRDTHPVSNSSASENSFPENSIGEIQQEEGAKNSTDGVKNYSNATREAEIDNNEADSVLTNSTQGDADDKQEKEPDADQVKDASRVKRDGLTSAANNDTGSSAELNKNNVEISNSTNATDSEVVHRIKRESDEKYQQTNDVTPDESLKNNSSNESDPSSNNTAKIRRSADGDPRYILVHDVPPCRRKRDFDEYESPSGSNGKGAINKNITIIIQNLLQSMRRKRDSLDPQPKIENVANTSLANQSNAGDEKDNRVKREPRRKKPIPTTKNPHHHHRDRRSVQDAQEKSKCCSNNLNNNAGDLQEVQGNTEAQTSIQRNYVVRIKPRKYVEEKEDLHRTVDQSGRKLLSFNVEANSENNLAAEHTNSIEEEGVNAQFFINHEVAMTSPKPSKDINHVKCACAMFFDEPDVNGRNPIITESFLEYTEETTASDREMLCSRVCSETSRLYYSLRQVVLCTHVQNFHHNLQAIVSIEHTSKEDDIAETIFCQVLPKETGPPLHYIISWLNIILLDVTVCLTGLGFVCMYLICTSKRRSIIPLYTTASFTVK